MVCSLTQTVILHAEKPILHSALPDSGIDNKLCLQGASEMACCDLTARLARRCQEAYLVFECQKSGLTTLHHGALYPGRGISAAAPALALGALAQFLCG